MGGRNGGAGLGSREWVGSGHEGRISPGLGSIIRQVNGNTNLESE